MNNLKINNLKIMDNFLSDLEVGYGTDFRDSENSFITLSPYVSKNLIKFIRSKVKELNLKMRKRGNSYVITA